MIRFIITALLLTGCGKEDKSPGEAASTTPTTEKAATYAMAVDESPGCGSSNKNQLIYVIPEKTFQTCNGTAWQTITVQGKDGTSGKDGTNGTNGKDGRDGQDGVDAVATVQSPSEWTDPITGSKWHMDGSIAMAGYDNACPAGTRHPTDPELVAAIYDGLYVASGAVGSQTQAWGANAPITGTLYDSKGQTQTVSGTATAGVFCIHQ